MDDPQSAASTSGAASEGVLSQLPASALARITSSATADAAFEALQRECLVRCYAPHTLFKSLWLAAHCVRLRWTPVDDNSTLHWLSLMLSAHQDECVLSVLAC